MYVLHNFPLKKSKTAHHCKIAARILPLQTPRDPKALTHSSGNTTLLSTPPPTALRPGRTMARSSVHQSHFGTGAGLLVSNRAALAALPVSSACWHVDFSAGKSLRPPLRQTAVGPVCTSIHQLPGSCTAEGRLSSVPAALTVLLRPSYMPSGLQPTSRPACWAANCPLIDAAGVDIPGMDCGPGW